MTGYIDDPRSEEEKKKDWKRSELFGASAYNWTVVPESKWAKYPQRYQNGSFMCMAFSGATALSKNEENENGTFLELSPGFIYPHRANAPAGGMYLQDLLKIMCEKGACLKNTLPSENLTEEQANQLIIAPEMRPEALRFKGKAYFVLTTLDEIAEAISRGYGVIITIKASESEWCHFEPVIIHGTTEQMMNVRHGVCGVTATIYKGKRGIIIYDSAFPKTTKDGKRFLSEDFLKTRLVQAGYVTDATNEEIDKPKLFFAIPLVYGDMNAQVVKLQKMLQYEKLLPTHVDNVLLPLGRFGSMTANALKKWQVKHGIMDFANLVDITKIRFGEKSIAKANLLYN